MIKTVVLLIYLFKFSQPLLGLCELLGAILGHVALMTGLRQPYWEQAAGQGNMPMAQMRRRPFMADLSVLDQVCQKLAVLIVSKYNHYFFSPSLLSLDPTWRRLRGRAWAICLCRRWTCCAAKRLVLLKKEKKFNLR